MDAIDIAKTRPKPIHLIKDIKGKDTPMDKRLLEILVCPLCKSPVHLDTAKQELICKADRLAYPIRNDIPVMLVDEARSLEADELA